MNIAECILDYLERKTLLHASLFDVAKTIQTQELLVAIDTLEKTSFANLYKVEGTLCIKSGNLKGYQIVTDLLDLPIAGAGGKATYTVYANGFSGMSLPFVFFAQRDKENFVISEIDLEEEKDE